MAPFEYQTRMLPQSQEETSAVAPQDPPQVPQAPQAPSLTQAFRRLEHPSRSQTDSQYD